MNEAYKIRSDRGESGLDVKEEEKDKRSGISMA